MTINDIKFAREIRLLKKAYQTSGLSIDDTIVQTNNAENGPFIYFVNMDSSSIFYLATIKNSLEIIKRATSSLALSYADIVDSFEECFTDLCGVKLPVGPVLKHNLCNTTCLYILGTQAYLESQEMGIVNPSFVVLRYKDASNNDYIIRSILVDVDGFVEATHIEAIVNKAILSDRIKHPQRFSSARFYPLIINNKTPI